MSNISSSPILTLTLQNRKAFKKILDTHSLEQLNFIPQNFSNNLLWNIAHAISVQQKIVYGLTTVPFRVDAAFVKDFAPGTRPEQNYDLTFVEELKSKLISSYKNMIEDIESGLLSNYTAYTPALNFEISDWQTAITFNHYHEALHMGACSLISHRALAL